VIKNMTIEEHKVITDKYIVPDKMYYVVVGDASTQMKPGGLCDYLCVPCWLNDSFYH